MKKETYSLKDFEALRSRSRAPLINIKLWFSYSSCRQFSSRKHKFLPDILFNSSTSMFSISFVNSCSCWNQSVEQNISQKLLKVADSLKKKKCKQAYHFSVNCVTCKREILSTYLWIAWFQILWHLLFLSNRIFSSHWSISDSETSTNLAATLKTASLQCYNHREVIIAGWSEAIINVIILSFIIKQAH